MHSRSFRQWCCFQFQVMMIEKVPWIYREHFPPFHPQSQQGLRFFFFLDWSPGAMVCFSHEKEGICHFHTLGRLNGRKSARTQTFGFEAAVYATAELTRGKVLTNTAVCPRLKRMSQFFCKTQKVLHMDKYRFRLSWHRKNIAHGAKCLNEIESVWMRWCIHFDGIPVVYPRFRLEVCGQLLVVASRVAMWSLDRYRKIQSRKMKRR